MSERLRLGMVGGGPGAFIGAVHRIAARLDDRWELVCVAFSADPERSREAGAGLHLRPERCHGDFRAMAALLRGRIDAVAIVTPNHLHASVAHAFLDAVIPVICDKPLTATLSDADALAARVAETGLQFVVTYNYTGYPMVRQARELARGGALGAIRTVIGEYAQDWLTRSPENEGQKQATWRTDPALTGARARSATSAPMRFTWRSS